MIKRSNSAATRLTFRPGHKWCLLEKPTGALGHAAVTTDGSTGKAERFVLMTGWVIGNPNKSLQNPVYKMSRKCKLWCELK